MIRSAEFAKLSSHVEPLSLSIHMPAHRGGSQVREDPIRLKNLLRRAEEQLLAAGMRSAMVRDRLLPLAALLEDQDFWMHQADGLAIFAARAEIHVLRVEAPLPEMLVLAERFYLRPLTGLVDRGESFYVLAISLNALRLFRAGRTDIQEAPLAGVPKSLAEAMRFDVYQKDMQWHTMGPVRGGDVSSAFFHGKGSSTDKAVQKRRMLEFCRLAERGVSRHIRQSPGRLLLAGAEPVVSLYRQVNTWPQLQEGYLQGNFDRTEPLEIHRQALGLIDQADAHSRLQLTRRYERAAGSELSIDDLGRIISAARSGQVQSLLLAGDQVRWGRLNPLSGELELHARRQNGDEDLLNLAALLTWQGGGEVVQLPSSQMPMHQPAVALLRYASVAAG